MYSAILLGAALLAQTFQGGDLLDVQESGIPVSGGTASGGITISGACSTAPNGTTVCYDNAGVVQGQSATTTDPLGIGVRAGACSPADATCTAANVSLFGGQDTTTIAIDGADPSVSCAGDNDTVTVTVYPLSGAAVATVLTEGTEWTASASVADTCTSLAAGVSALSGVSATCTSPDVLVSLDASTGAVELAESTAGCTTVSTGVRGLVRIGRDSSSTTELTLAIGSGGGGFGPGGTGFYLFANNVAEMAIDGNGIHGTAGGSTALLVNENMSVTNPGFTAAGDIDTGQGWVSADHGSLIAGGVQAMGWSEATDTLVYITGGFRPSTKTGDPCADTANYPAGTIFYNATSNYHCFCNGSGADIKMNDNTTACF